MTQICGARRGFAAMEPEIQRELARKGGQAAHQKGMAHQFNADEARIAGRMGGVSVSRNREYMAMIGKKGGQISGRVRTRPGHGATMLAGPIRVAATPT